MPLFATSAEDARQVAEIKRIADHRQGLRNLLLTPDGEGVAAKRKALEELIDIERAEANGDGYEEGYRNGVDDGRDA